jgi:hypothetical protein
MSGKATKPDLMRVILTKREVQRVTTDWQGLRVRSGRAWISLNGRDLVLKRGQTITVESKDDFALVSPLGGVPLVIELLGEAPCQPTSDPRPVLRAVA